MTHQIKMPKVAMAMNEGTITQWYKSAGDEVQKGDVLFEIETEKTAYEVEATASGTLEIVIDSGETVKVETVVGALLSGDEKAEPLAVVEPPATDEKVEPSPTDIVAVPVAPIADTIDRIKASPLAKKLAAQNNIDLSQVQSSAAHGRIKKRDIEAYLAARPASMSTPQGGFERVKLTPMRQSVSDGVMKAVNGQAMTPNAIEINMENLIAVRDSFKAQDEAYAASISYQSFFIKALALAARDVPITNARMGDGYIDIFNDVNVAFAVAIDDSHPAFSGLVMPVIHQADKKGVLEIQQELMQLVARARERRLTASDMQDGTITLSSTAGMVADYMISTPLLNQGQSYIGQPGNIVERPIVRDGELTVGKIMSFCFTFDHRVMDGVPACHAASRFKDYIENPSLMLR